MEVASREVCPRSYDMVSQFGLQYFRSVFVFKTIIELCGNIVKLEIVPHQESAQYCAILNNPALAILSI